MLRIKYFLFKKILILWLEVSVCGQNFFYCGQKLVHMLRGERMWLEVSVCGQKFLIVCLILNIVLNSYIVVRS